MGGSSDYGTVFTFRAGASTSFETSYSLKDETGEGSNPYGGVIEGELLFTGVLLDDGQLYGTSDRGAPPTRARSFD